MGRLEIDRQNDRHRLGRRIVGILVATVLLWAPNVAEACAVCYGATDSPMTEGMNNGILVLLAIVAAVQIGFVALFVSIRQRSRRLDQRKKEFQVIQGGAG